MKRDLWNTVSDARMRLAVLTGLALAFVGTAAPIQAQTSITSCPYAINEPGNYVLGANLSCVLEDGISIYASNVQLNLNGHTISGGGSSGFGGSAIVVDPGGVGLSGIQIKGPGLLEQFFDGIDINPAGGPSDNDIQISKVTAALNAYGLFATNVTGLQLQQNVFAGNSFEGLELDSSGNCQIQQNDVSGNGGSGGLGGGLGILLTKGSGNKVQNNTADGNTGDGIEILRETDDQVQNNATHGNSSDGIQVSGGGGHGQSGGGNQLQNNTSEGNGNGGAFHYDLEDDQGCGTNSWQNDIFFTSNPGSCVH